MFVRENNNLFTQYNNMTDIDALKNEASGILSSIKSLSKHEKIHAIKRLRIIHSKLLHCMVKAANKYSDSDPDQAKLQASLAMSYADHVHQLIREAQEHVGDASHHRNVIDVVVRPLDSGLGELSLRNIDTVPMLDVSSQAQQFGNLNIPGVTSIGDLSPDANKDIWTTLLGGKTGYEHSSSHGTSNMIDNLRSEEALAFIMGKNPRSGVTVVKFWADWCGPSNTFKPIWHEFTERARKEGIQVYHVNVGTDPERTELAAKWGVKSYPSVVVISGNKKAILSNVSGLNASSLHDLVKKHA